MPVFISYVSSLINIEALLALSCYKLFAKFKLGVQLVHILIDVVALIFY